LIDTVGPEFSLFKVFLKKKKLTQAEHTARGTCMRRGLKSYFS